MPLRPDAVFIIVQHGFVCLTVNELRDSFTNYFHFECPVTMFKLVNGKKAP